jgi:cytochrome c biogenesis protein CcmG, thiol:disulfide interchange protein DsbE
MKRAFWPLLLFAGIVAVLLFGLWRAPEKSIIDSPLIGKPAPAFRAPQLIDPTQVVSEQTLAGQWRLLNVWGTWCPGCRTEHAALLAIEKEGRVPIIGLDWKDDDAAAMNWLAQLGDPYAAVGTDKDGRIAIDWGVYGAPESFLINPEGRVVAKQTGPMTMEIWVQEFLPHLGANAPVAPR